MKNQNLYLVAGALFASTALTTAASAGSFSSTVAAGAAVADYEAPVLAIEAMPDDADDAAAVTIGPFNALSFAVDGDITDDFIVSLRPTGADFQAIAGTVTLLGLANGSTTALSNSTCSTTRGDALIVLNCTISASADTSTIAAVQLTGLVIDDAGGLAVSDAEVTINGALTVNDFTFDELDGVTLISSGSAAEIEGEASEDVSIDADSDPQFATVGEGDLSAVIANITFTLTGAVGTALDVIDTKAEAFGATDFTLAHDILNQAAVTQVEFGAVTVEAEDFDDGEAVFEGVAAAALDDNDLEVTFDGETAIEEADAGTLTYSLAAGTLITGVGYEEDVEVATAGFIRGGLNVSLNYLLASGGGFSSYARITNTGTDAAPVTITLIDAATGETLGDSFETDDVEPGATIQLSAADIEEGAGVTVDAAAVPLYNATITGALVGYVQHILFNDTTQFASDLSGFRSSGLVEQ